MEHQTVIQRQIQGAEPYEEVVVLPDAAPHSNEGKTVAGWTVTWVTSIGAAVAAIGMILAIPTVLWVGIGVAVLGPVLGLGLRLAGHGQPRTTPDGDRVA